MVRPLRRSSSSLISIAISRSRVPWSSTSETDGSPSSALRTSSAASRNWFSLATDDETARVIASTDTRASSISGRSAFGGGKFSMASHGIPDGVQHGVRIGEGPPSRC